MALAFDDRTSRYAAPRDKASRYDATIDEVSPIDAPDIAMHAETYRKFTVYARIAACAVPLFMVFLLYWTT
jgi:hypothetical protein